MEQLALGQAASWWKCHVKLRAVGGAKCRDFGENTPRVREWKPKWGQLHATSLEEVELGNWGEVGRTQHLQAHQDG